MADDVFEKLFDDGIGEDTDELLADTIYPYMRFANKANPEPIFTEEGEGLTVQKRILIFLLGRKVLVKKDIIGNEGIPPIELEKLTGIPGGSIRPILKKLIDEKLAKTDTNGGYYIPNTKIRQVCTSLKEKPA